MSGELLSQIATILERTALRASEFEIAAMIDQARDASPSLEAAQDFERLHLHLNTLAQGIRDSEVTERALNMLIDTTRDLSGMLSLQDLLRTIVSRARSLVGANIVWLTLLDEESNILRIVTAEGHLSPATAEMTARVGYGAVSLIVSSKSFFDTQDYLGDQRFRHSPALDRVFRAESISSLAGFPILTENKLQGILFIADRYRRKLSGREISVLGSFALHAGVAMRNAQAFRMLSEALAEAERNRKALIDYIQRVDASAATHDEMTSLLAKGADWPHFVQRMANQINGAIVLFDETLAVRERFTSTTYRGRLAERLGNGKFDSAVLVTAISQSRHSGRSVVMLDDGDEHCRAMALHGGAGRGESLIICHRGELDPIDIRNLERSAVALSIAKLWSEKRETEKLIASSTLLRHLVLVNPPDESVTSAVRDRLGINADQPVVMVLFAISGLDRTSQTAVVRTCAARINLLVDLVDDFYLAIGLEKPIRAFIHNLLGRRRGWEVGGIVSDAFPDLALTSINYSRIEQAFRVLRKMKRLGRLVEQGQVGLFARLFESGDAARISRYVESVLASIEQRDPHRRTNLKQTLLCFFDSQHNIARTADLLGIHVNTVRQRLETLRDITGGWDDPVAALELHVALRLDAITEPS